MIYLNENDLKNIGVNWNEVVDTIEKATRCLADKDYSQPIKPYLRYGDLKNRIIAMPAFVGGDINKAGIKWIASFPDNTNNNIPRAHSVVILNNADTGKPEAIVNTAKLSMIRTAGVTGSIIRAYKKTRMKNKVNVGIIGWGPIGRHHFSMITSLLGDKISKIFLYDLRTIDRNSIGSEYRDKVEIVKTWQGAYKDSDIVMTCTVSKKPYIDMKPKKGALLLNVSLRDYKTDIYDYVKGNIIVDDWDEVCREETDIEMMHIKKGLNKEETKSIVDVLCNNCFKTYSEDDVVMFNPMGMAVFDVSIAEYYVRKAKIVGSGKELD